MLDENTLTYIHDADDQSFNEKVVHKSLSVPILVDCWAEWCEPCKNLTPTLEQLTQEYKGRFELVKVNIDLAPQVSMALRIQSVPFMILFIEGRPVDALVGQQNTTAIKEFLDKHIPADESDPFEQGILAMQTGDLPVAQQYFEQAWQENPERMEVLLELARVRLFLGDAEQASQYLASIPTDHELAAEAAKLKQVFQFAEFAGDIEQLQAQLREDPTILEAWHRLGASWALQGHFEESCESFLQIVKRDRSYRDDIGRTSLLTLFEILGGQGEVVVKYRSKLTQVLF
jgi:putative thioredoxin